MVVCNLYFVYISTPPFKTDAPLLVDANTKLALSVARKLLQTTRRRYAQILQDLRCVQDSQSPSGNPLDALREFARELTIKDSLRFLTREGLYHHLE